MQVEVSFKLLATPSLWISLPFPVPLRMCLELLRQNSPALSSGLWRMCKIKNEFYIRGGFPGVVGCVYGTHVRLQAPTQNVNNCVNRKGFHSINVQGVCNVVAHWLGSTHDSCVFRTSKICSYLQNNHRSLDDGVLPGDSGYACSPFLMTPFATTRTPSQEAYNSAHTKTRMVIEQTFGRWKITCHRFKGSK